MIHLGREVAIIGQACICSIVRADRSASKRDDRQHVAVFSDGGAFRSTCKGRHAPGSMCMRVPGGFVSVSIATDMILLGYLFIYTYERLSQDDPVLFKTKHAPFPENTKYVQYSGVCIKPQRASHS